MFFSATFCFMLFRKLLHPLLHTHTVQKMKFSIKDFFSKYDQIRRKLRIWSHLRKKSLMENFIFCAVSLPLYKILTNIFLVKLFYDAVQALNYIYAFFPIFPDLCLNFLWFLFRKEFFVPFYSLFFLHYFVDFYFLNINPWF